MTWVQVSLFDELAEEERQRQRYPRPVRRAECLPGGWNEGRPCPFVGCRHHLCVEVVGSRVVETRELDDGHDTCSLDVADRDGMTLEDIGPLLGDVTRERVRQIEAKAIGRIRMKPNRRAALAPFLSESDDRLVEAVRVELRAVEVVRVEARVKTSGAAGSRLPRSKEKRRGGSRSDGRTASRT